jgi:hypothetical protein
MKRIVFACASLLVLSLTMATARAENFAGTWSIAPSSKAGEVNLELRYTRSGAFGNEQWDESEDTPISQLRGLTAADIRDGGARKSFSIEQDAGDFQADGTFNGDTGGGTWTFRPNPSFANDLRRRGIGAPSDKQQFELAMARFKLSTLDALLASGFERPSIDDLVRMGQHGVTNDYITAMKNVRLSPKRVSELIRMRDHGVSARYAADMLRRAPQLSAEDLIELRDHGVSSDYMAALADAGYGNVSPSDAERMVDHGVSRSYLQGLRNLGYHPSVDDLVRLVDHGVSINFIERMRQHGYTRLSVDDLIRLRDHGF